MITDRSLLEERGGRGEEEGRRRRRGRRSRRDAGGTQAGRKEEEEKTGAERGRGSRVWVHDSCAYSSIVSLFLQITNSIYFTHFGIRLSLSRRGSDS